MGMLRSAAARIVSPASTPGPPLYVGMPTSSAISMEKYAMVLSVSMLVTPCSAELERCWRDQLWRQQGLQFLPFQDFVLQQAPRQTFQGRFFRPEELAHPL